MDQRLQYIAEHFDELVIGPDEPFQFHCTQCGKCCVNREDILLNPKDLFRISQYLGLTPQETVSKYCEVYIGSSSRLPIVRLKPQGSRKRCPFLKDQKCSVHPVKPAVCAMFPIGRCVRWQKGQEVKEDIQIEYILNDPGCGDRSETHTVREWLGSFGIPVDDLSFRRWQKAVITIGTEIQKMESAFPQNMIDILWNIVYIEFYLRYDTNQDFDEQFIRNSAKVDEMMQRLLKEAEDTRRV